LLNQVSAEFEAAAGKFPKKPLKIKKTVHEVFLHEPFC